MSLQSVHISLAFRLILLMVIPLAFGSCADEDGVDGPVDMALWDIVTYTGPAAGGGSVFEFRQVDDSPLVTLTSTRTVPSELEPGARVMICYIPENGKAYTSGPIDLRSVARVNSAAAELEWKSDYDAWNRDKVYVYSAWRSGNYINFHLRLTYSTEPRIFSLVLDPSTADSDMPELYLVHIMAQETDNHDRAYFASFDIESVWSRPEVKGVRIHVADTNLTKDIFTFSKAD